MRRWSAPWTARRGVALMLCRWLGQPKYPHRLRANQVTESARHGKPRSAARPSWSRGPGARNPAPTRMDEALHKYWDKPLINWCRILSIHRRALFGHWVHPKLVFPEEVLPVFGSIQRTFSIMVTRGGAVSTTAVDMLDIYSYICLYIYMYIYIYPVACLYIYIYIYVCDIARCFRIPRWQVPQPPKNIRIPCVSPFLIP